MMSFDHNSTSCFTKRDQECVCLQNYTEGVTYANVPYPKEALAALANIDEDFPGSCGRCYEVRCKNGLVLSNGTSIFNTTQGYNLPAHAPNATDDYNRT